MYLLNYGFSLATCPEMGLLGHMVALFLVFQGTSILFSIVATSHQQCRKVSFSPHSLTFFICRLYDVGHSEWYEVISHCSFSLHHSNN